MESLLPNETAVVLSTLLLLEIIWVSCNSFLEQTVPKTERSVSAR